jgi:hypothetical protein
MKRLLLVALLLAPTASWAQQSADSAAQALGQMVMEAVKREAMVRAQLIAAEARVAALEAAAKAAQPAKAAPTTPAE